MSEPTELAGIHGGSHLLLSVSWCPLGKICYRRCRIPPRAADTKRMSSIRIQCFRVCLFFRHLLPSIFGGNDSTGDQETLGIKGFFFG